MSNRNRKAKETGYRAKKLEKAQQKIEVLQEQVRAARMSVLNMRQMLEASEQKLDAAQRRLDQATQIITAAILQERKNRLVIKEATFPKLVEFVGYDLDDEEGDLVLTPVHVDDLETEEVEPPVPGTGQGLNSEEEMTDYDYGVVDSTGEIQDEEE